uniref:Urotensin-2 receptor n=1 Tax=Leptobrachium leishanense TaxID=445787 RepID=A0A8C5PWY5_9ANUR
MKNYRQNMDTSLQNDFSSNMSTNISSLRNTSYNTNDDLIETTVFGILLSLMGIIGMVGNCYILLIMCKSMNTFTSTYIHIINLALADMMYLSTIPFIVHNNFVKDWYFGEVGCRLLLSLDLLTMHASIFILTVMSTERYIAVTKPFDIVRKPRGYQKSLACAIWIFSFFLTLPMMLMLQEEERTLENGTTRKLCTATRNVDHYKIYLTVLFSISILAPGVIIGYLYIKLGKAYWISQTNSFLNKELHRSPKQRVIFMIFIIVLAFWACFLPFWIWQLVHLYSHHELKVKTEIYITHFVSCMTYSNSCINPFLYTLLTKKYKEYLLNRQVGGHGSFCLKNGIGLTEKSVQRTIHQQCTEIISTGNAIDANVF